MPSCIKINYVATTAHLPLLLVLNEHFPSFLTDSQPGVVHRKEVKIRIILYTLGARSWRRICRICGIASVPNIVTLVRIHGSIAPLRHRTSQLSTSDKIHNPVDISNIQLIDCPNAMNTSLAVLLYLCRNFCRVNFQ